MGRCGDVSCMWFSINLSSFQPEKRALGRELQDFHLHASHTSHKYILVYVWYAEEEMAFFFFSFRFLPLYVSVGQLSSRRKQQICWKQTQSHRESKNEWKEENEGGIACQREFLDSFQFCFLSNMFIESSLFFSSLLSPPMRSTSSSFGRKNRYWLKRQRGT